MTFRPTSKATKAALLGTVGIALAAGSALARPPRATTLASARIEVGEPDGFAALTQPQLAIVDVYYGGAKVGATRVRFAISSVTLLDPEGVAAMLPPLARPEQVKSALAKGDLAANVERNCPLGQTSGCGTLDPDVAGVIFDRDRFRMDVFVNPQLVEVRLTNPELFLAPPASGASLVDSISAVMAGSTGGTRSYFLQNRAVLGSGNRRLRADLAYASGFGVQADTLAVEIDRPGWRYSAGAFWAPGIELTGRRKIVGVGIASQIDTRLDKEELRGNPLVVFLNRRSRVDIVREGRILASGIYDGGNQQLDTSMLPEGAYQLTLRVEGAAGEVREESRFFARNPQIAAVGQDIAFAYAGLASDDRRGQFLDFDGTPFFEAGLAHRVSPKLALDATMMATDRTVLGEVGGYLLTGPAQVRLAAVGTADGSYGGVMSVSSQGNSQLNYNFDLRHITVGGADAFTELARGSLGRPRIDGGDPLAVTSTFGAYTQLNGVVSYSLKTAQVLVSAAVRRDEQDRTNYTIGPAFRMEVYRSGPLRALLNGDFSLTRDGHSGFVGLSLQMLNGRAAVGSSVGVRSSSFGGNNSTSSLRSITGSWQVDDVAGGELNLGGGYERDSGRDLINASADLRGRRAALSGDISQPLGGGAAQYSLGFQTMLAADRKGVAFNGKDIRDSAIVVAVRGARASDAFDVLVDESVVGSVTSGTSLSVPLAPYRQYRVRLRPASSSPLRFDDKARTVALYPGNVPRLEWSAHPLTAVFGRLVVADGTPLQGAQITEAHAISQTDERGFFQIDATPGASLSVVGPDGRTCHAILPTVSDDEPFVAVGTLTCTPQDPSNYNLVGQSAEETAK